MSSLEAVREAAREMGRFTASEVARVAGVSRTTAFRRIEVLMDRGLISDTGERVKHNGPGRPATVYRWSLVSARTLAAMRAEPVPRVDRPKRIPVEREVAAAFRVLEPRRKQRKRKRRVKPQDRDVRALIAPALAAGAETYKDGAGKIRIVMPDGRQSKVADTPSDARTVKNERAKLRRAGIPTA